MEYAQLMGHIENLKQQLITNYVPEKIILFGSALHEGAVVNDVDLFIIKDDVPYLGAERIRQLYRLMETDIPVDYVVYRPSEVKKCLELGEPFVTGILKEGKVLYG